MLETRTTAQAQQDLYLTTGTIWLNPSAWKDSSNNSTTWTDWSTANFTVNGAGMGDTSGAGYLLMRSGTSGSPQTTLNIGNINIAGSGGVVYLAINNPPYNVAVQNGGTINTAASTAIRINGAYDLSLGGANGSIIKTGAGLLSLGYANASSRVTEGSVDIQGGTVQIYNGNTITQNRTGLGFNLDGGNLELATQNATNTGYTVKNLTGSSGIVAVGTTKVADLVPVAVTSATLTINQTTSGSFGGSIQNGTAGQLLVNYTVGSGQTYTLGGANTYTGATTLSGGGTLLVNGSLGNTAVTVTAGTLGGTGSIAGNTEIRSGATLTGKLTLGNLQLDAGSITSLSFGQVINVGSVTIDTNALLNYNFTGFSVVDGDNIINIFNGSTLGGFGDLSSVESSLVSYLGSNFTYNNDLVFSNGQLTFSVTAIPEPSTFLLLGAGILLLISLRSRRTNKV